MGKLRGKVAGEVFERVALHVLEKEIGEPDNPALSKFLVDVMRNPRDYLRRVQTALTSALRKPELFNFDGDDIQRVNKTIRQLEIDSAELPKLPRNSDAIAYKNASDGKSVQITGSYEMKGYRDISDTDELMAIGLQLEDSKDEIYRTFSKFAKYYTTFKVLCATDEEKVFLPEKIELIEKDDFETTLVVPENTVGVESDAQIEQTLAKLEKYGCTDIKKIGIKTKQIGTIVNDLTPRVITKLSSRYRRS